MAGKGSSQPNEGGQSLRRVTLRDIAREAGVSLPTVSYALRGIPRVSEKMRTHILEVAEKLDYKPDERMAALSRYRKDSKKQPTMVKLAWLNLWDDPTQLHVYREFELYYKGASLAAEQLGFQIEEVVAMGLSPKQLAAEVKRRGMRGILIAPCSRKEAYLEEFPIDDFTIVRFGLETESPHLHSITADQIGNGETAVEHIRAKGYHRIGLVTGTYQKMPFAAGVFWAQKEIPRSERVPPLLLSMEEETSRAIMITKLAEWMEKAKPDVILTSYPHVFDVLKDLGYRIPEDVALAATSIHDAKTDAGIDQNPEETGRMALLTLISLMDEQGRTTSSNQNQTLIEGAWVDGSMMPYKIPGDECPSAVGNARGSQWATVEKSSQRVPAAGERRVTQRDIAKALGVSHVTVSLALRNDPRCASKTRARVQIKAGEMGYVADPMLAALGSYCRAVREKPIQASLAWLNLWPNPQSLYTYHEFNAYWEGALECARRIGYDLEEFSVAKIPLPRLHQILKARNIRGILIPPSPLPAMTDMSRFPWQNYDMVKLGVTCPIAVPYAVTVDDIANSALALEKLVEKGYTRVAYVGDRALQRTFGAGFYWAQRQLSVQLPEFFLPLKEPARHRKKLAAWIHKEQPDAILTDNGTVPRLLSDLGIRVPDDIALATDTLFDTPIDAGIDHNAREIGRMGVISLVSHIKDTRKRINAIESKVLVPGSWVDGDMLPSRM